MRAVESGRHEEGGTIDISSEVKVGMRVFVGLHAREGQAEEDGENQSPLSPFRSSSSNAWCAQVTVVPDVSRINVLRSGRCQGSNVSIPFGGQTPPVAASRPMSLASPGNSAVLK